MAATEFSGKPLSAAIRAAAAERAAKLIAAGSRPKLAIVSASDDASSAWYVRSLVTAAGKVGIEADVVALGADADEGTIAAALQQLSAAPDVHGIILQTPLPAGVDHGRLVAEIAPAKDVDGANPLSLGRLASKRSASPRPPQRRLSAYSMATRSSSLVSMSSSSAARWSSASRSGCC